MQRLKELEPQVFVDRHEPLPDAPMDPAEVAKDPTLAAFTYHREIPHDSLAVNLLHHVAQYTGQVPKTAEQPRQR